MPHSLFHARMKEFADEHIEKLEKDSRIVGHMILPGKRYLLLSETTRRHAVRKGLGNAIIAGMPTTSLAKEL